MAIYLQPRFVMVGSELSDRRRYTKFVFEIDTITGNLWLVVLRYVVFVATTWYTVVNAMGNVTVPVPVPHWSNNPLGRRVYPEEAFDTPVIASEAPEIAPSTEKSPSNTFKSPNISVL